MKRVTIARCCALLAFALPLSAPSAHAAALGTAFTYQGSIDRNGIAPSDSCTFNFALFDSPLNGTQIGTTITTKVAMLQNGQFSAPLDFGAGIFDGTQRWLEVSVKCPGDGLFTSLNPRQPITATPYALYALAAPSGGGGFVLPYFGAVTSTATDAFKVQNNATTGAVVGIHGVSASTSSGSAAAMGEATGASGLTLGLFGKALASPNGTGVVGQGGQTGGWFEAFAASGDGTGLNGVAHTTTNSAAGVKGQNLATSGFTVGVWGLATPSPDGTGVAGTGGAVGGWFTSNSTNPVPDYAGVYGSAVVHPGVKGKSAQDVGVRGEGVHGVVGAANSGSNGNGLWGIGDGDGAGVLGNGFANGSGVLGSAVNGYGVYGGSNTNYGVYGTTQSNVRAGVYGTTTVGDGVWGQSSAPARSGTVGISSNAAGYGGFFANTGGGVAMLCSGLAQVKTLQILGADLAESFPVHGERIEPGTVLAIDGGGDGSLRVCDEPYCRRVAGVVSGAHGLDAAVILKGANFDSKDRAAVAMSGRVWVRCDASRAPIRVGDLLTTSDHAGEAMRASDEARAYGAVLGKAMTSLETGSGLVLVLVNLQ